MNEQTNKTFFYGFCVCVWGGGCEGAYIIFRENKKKNIFHSFADCRLIFFCVIKNENFWYLNAFLKKILFREADT